MSAQQFNLCLEILRRFERANLLKNLILIGCWCMVFYEEAFFPNEKENFDPLKTHDIDFLLPYPSKLVHPVNVPELVNDLGFVSTIGLSQTIAHVVHPDLTLKILVPERGQGHDKPVFLPQLGMNALALRFSSFLTESLVSIPVEDFEILVPHPIQFAFDKLLMSQKRINKNKATRENKMGVQILSTLIKQGEQENIGITFSNISSDLKKEILAGINAHDHADIFSLLTASLEADQNLP